MRGRLAKVSKRRPRSWVAGRLSVGEWGGILMLRGALSSTARYLADAPRDDETVRITETVPQCSQSPVLLVIPCYNEEASIGDLLIEIARTSREYHTLVIDDGSSDATCAIASAYSQVARLAQNLGIGGAVQTGFKYAARNGYDFCIQIDGDGQHNPREIEALLNAYRKQPTNIIIGSRFIHNAGFRSTLLRRLGSNIIALSLNYLFKGGRITDPTSGMRLLDRRAIDFFAQRYPMDFPEPISLAWAMRSGLAVGEAPVEMRARKAGESSIDGLKPVTYMIRVLGYILLARLSRSDFKASIKCHRTLMSGSSSLR